MGEQLQIYRFRENVLYQIEGDVIRISGRQGSTRFESTVDLETLSPESDRFWLRDRRKALEYLFLAMLLLAIPILIATAARFDQVWVRAVNFSYWGVLGLMLLGVLLRPTVEVATFKYRTGQQAFSIYRVADAKGKFPEFVAAVSDAVRAKQRPNSSLQPARPASP